MSEHETKLEWIQMKEDFEKDAVETGQEKFIRKFKSNPLVPVGELLSYLTDYLSRYLPKTKF